MNWYCFKFWLVWRLVMVTLSHFNWFTAIYMKCVYFTMWKSYDMLWFWMHLVLCIFLKSLRTENYLLVVCNMVMAKRNRYRNKSYKKIYHLLYKKTQRFTKSERALKRMETIERGRRDDNEQNIDDDDIDDSSSSENEDSDVETTAANTVAEQLKNRKYKNKAEFPKPMPAPANTNSDDNGERSRMLYPQISEMEEQPMPSISVDRTRSPNVARARADAEVPLVDVANSVGPKNGGKGSEVTSSSNSVAQRVVNSLPQKILPNFVKKVVGADTSSLDPSEKALVEQEKARLKAEKRLQKQRQKEVDTRRKAELRERAKIERRRRNLAAAVDLLLTWLRLMTTFAIMVGNIHKTFMPKYLIAPGQDFYDKPDLLMLFTITVSLDIFLFWLMMLWTYCKQCRLCCRLGICRFWLWLITLSFFGGVCMYMPMHYIHEQLDMSWCAFMPGSDLSEYFDG